MNPITGSGMDRREFVERLGGSALVLAASLSGCRWVNELLGGAPRSPAASVTPVAYLRIDDTGAVTVICHRSEMGQGIRTSVAMIVADELDADWSKVRIEQAPGDEKTYGSQNTDGSRSIRDFYTVLREAGATGRALLESAAAKKWGVRVSEVEARQHTVVHRSSGRTIGYGELVELARTLPVPEKNALRLKLPGEFRYIGTAMPIVDLDDITRGAAVYGMDLRREGMLVAVVARPPVYGDTLKSVNSSAAEQEPGVERVIRLDTPAPPTAFKPLGGVAVLARNTWAAIRGRERLEIEWDGGGNADYNSAGFRAELEQSVRRPGRVVRKQGNVSRALAQAVKRVEADYYLPHLSHAQMEPPAALAVFENGQCDIWAPTQSPQDARDTVAEVLGIPVDDVQVHVTLLGGGFGRKSKPDFVVEAALLARDAGKPVKVVWTREDDIRHDYFHSVAAQHLEAGLDADGRVTAWLHRSAFPSIGTTFSAGVTNASDVEMALGVTDLPYLVPNLRLENGAAAAHTRIGWYRSVHNVHHAFAIASFVDELAHAAGKDPRDFLLELLGPDRVVDMAQAGLQVKPWNYGASFEEHPVDTARYRVVVELAARESGWDTPLNPGAGRGIAVHRSFLSYVATVVQVQVEPDGALRIPRVDVAIDAGQTVHPDRVRAQIEGATIMGLGNALYGEITFKDGAPIQSNFTDYRVPRIDATPRDIMVHIVPGAGRPGGVGEPGVPPLAPALCNAIFAATGRRIRSLPVAGQITDGIASA